jgi:hypothetical protein
VTSQPLPMQWTGTGFEVLRRAADAADRQYVVGEVYRVLTEEERSDLSHNHEFAFVREAWKTLPDNLAESYPSPEHLRKRALIQAGFFDEQIIDVGTNAGAIRVARDLGAFPGEEFSLVIVRGTFVIIRRAKSQSRRAMGKEMFQASKTGIMQVIADMLDVTPDDLSRAQAA